DHDCGCVSADVQVAAVGSNARVQKVMEVKEEFVMMEDMHRLDLQGLTGNYRAGEGQKGGLGQW
nr:hypothetical protein [Tanacetum cinerariifolium]